MVIYMGMKKLKEISQVFIEENAGNLPAAIIQHASLPKQKMSKGMVKNLEKIAADNHLTHPSIIVIGQVVDILKSFSEG